MNSPPASSLPPAGPIRRLLAMFYDTLLLLSVLLVTVALLLMVSRGTFTYHNPFFRTLLFLICFSFYAWFWLHGGQTLGMRSWRLRIQDRSGASIGPWQALLRFLLAAPSLALFGIGFFWMLLDPDRQTLYDRCTRTRVVLLPQNPCTPDRTRNSGF